MMREGSSEKNLESLVPLINDKNYHRCMLVTDDRNVFSSNKKAIWIGRCIVR